MKPIGEIFSKTNQAFKENWLSALVVSFVFFLIYGVAIFAVGKLFGIPNVDFYSLTDDPSLVELLTKPLLLFLVILFVSFPLIWSYNTMFLSKIRGGELSVSQLFNGFSDPLRIVWSYVLIFLIFLAFILLYSLLSSFLGIFLMLVSPILNVLIGFFLSIALFIGLIIYRLMFSLFEYILFDDEEISAFGSLKKSVQLMKGHKLQLFVTIFLFNLAVIFAMLIPVIILALAIDQESKILVIFSAVVVIVEALAFMSYSGMLMAHFYESVIDEENGGAEPIAEQATVADGPAADFEEK